MAHTTTISSHLATQAALASGARVPEFELIHLISIITYILSFPYWGAYPVGSHLPLSGYSILGHSLIYTPRPLYSGEACRLPAGVSSISEIDIGLTFLTGDESSPAPNVVSIFYAAGRSVVVVTAYLEGDF